MHDTGVIHNQTRSQSRNEINTHTEHLVQKHNDLLSLKRSYLVRNGEKRKQGNKPVENVHEEIRLSRLRSACCSQCHDGAALCLPDHPLSFRVQMVSEKHDAHFIQPKAG